MKKTKNVFDTLTDIPLMDLMDKPRPLALCNYCKRERHNLHDYDGIKVCSSCVDTELETCQFCKTKQVRISHGSCHTCTNNSTYVYDYDYKPEPVFHRVNTSRDGKPPLLTHKAFCARPGMRESRRLSPLKRRVYYPEHYGVEIETDIQQDEGYTPDYVGTRLASLVNCVSKGSTLKENLLYCKNDSTAFVEVVSHPFSWNYFNKYGKKVFQTLFTILRKNGLYGQDTNDCGLHIHVSRKSINETSIYKIISFIYNAYNYPFIKLISQRDDNKLAEWCTVDIDPQEKLQSGKLHYANRWDNEKMEAVNLRHSQTIEFRLFNGTLNFNTFCKNLEFVRSLIHWAKETSLSVSASLKAYESLNSYLDFLARNQSKYLNLCFYISKHKDDIVTNSQALRKTVKGLDLSLIPTKDKMTRKYMTELYKLNYNDDHRELI